MFLHSLPRMLRGLAAFTDPLSQNLGSLVLNLWDANPRPRSCMGNSRGPLVTKKGLTTIVLASLSMLTVLSFQYWPDVSCVIASLVSARRVVSVWHAWCFLKHLSGSSSRHKGGIASSRPSNHVKSVGNQEHSWRQGDGLAAGLRKPWCCRCLVARASF